MTTVSPPLISSLESTTTTSSILTLVLHPITNIIYAGHQNGTISCWHLTTLTPLEPLLAHSGPILSLLIVPAPASLPPVATSSSAFKEDAEVDWLISSSGDGTIRVWNLFTSSILYLIHCPRDNMGDILSLLWVDQVHSTWEEDRPESISERRLHKITTGGRKRGRLYSGCQDTTIMWIDLPPPPFYSNYAASPSPLTAVSSQQHHLLPKSTLTSSLNAVLTPRTRTHTEEDRPSLSQHQQSSLPIISKPHNKFFDTLTPSERPVRTPSNRTTTSSSQSGTPPINSPPMFRSSSSSSYLSFLPTEPPPSNDHVVHGFRDAMGVEMIKHELESNDDVNPEEGMIELQIRAKDVKRYAHYGYVYCLALGKSNDQQVVISGSGDAMIKLWTLTPPDASSLASPMSKHSKDLTHLATLEGGSDAVLSMVLKDEGATLIAGYQSGLIKIWDLNTLVCVKSLRIGQSDILTLVVIREEFYSGAANGLIHCWDKSFNCVKTWTGHDSVVLALAASSPGSSDSNGEESNENGQRSRGASQLITGGSDSLIKVWDISKGDALDLTDEDNSSRGFQGAMFHTLAKLVSFKTIADDAHREECRQGALYFKSVLKALGARTLLLPGAQDRNPIIVATFLANSSSPSRSSSPTPPHSDATSSNRKRRKRVLVYGHYDVIAADTEEEKWINGINPFEMVGLNGWVYGRGVSDNKGPLLAIAAAASELRAAGQLDVDVVMIIEGEEETGSAGFQEAIRKHAETIGEIDVILVSNSYWIGEHIPCLTFGLRGVIHATLNITSNQPTMHSGIQGGTVHEPLIDMVRLLATLTSSTDGEIAIPQFYDRVSTMGEVEKELLDEVVLRDRSHEELRESGRLRESLISRWRQPALSMHTISVVTGSSSKTLISGSVSATISVRIVPDQEMDVIRASIQRYLEEKFAEFGSRNQLSIENKHVADWWLSDLSSPYLKAFAKCIENEWNIKPLYIREGGSIPSLPFLEQIFGARAVQFPMGTSSDGAHLANERIRVINLEKGKKIVQSWLGMLDSI